MACRKITLAACSLNQWALDFEGNLKRILQSISEAKAKGACYRLGPELEVSGYGCEDHFLEDDTFLHSFQVLACILKSPVAQDIVCDIGMPIQHKSVRYNCKVIFYNRKILLIRPKTIMANDGNYRELRWFSPWQKARQTEEFVLPKIITDITGQTTVPFGDAIVSTNDTSFGTELCEEMFASNAPSIHLGLDGVEIFTNSSGSYHQLRKLQKKIDLIKGVTKKSGGIYMYANARGCDGGRVYFDGCSIIAVNGEIVAQGQNFSLQDVETVTATVDLNDVTTYRGSANCLQQLGAKSDKAYSRICLDQYFCSDNPFTPASQAVPLAQITPEQEISLGPACWMWDYLRRSGMSGFFLPLSGGIDSSSVACLVASMSHLVCRAVKNGDKQVLEDARRIVGDREYVPVDPKELANRIFVTCYMGSENSSEDTRSRAKNLAQDVGSYHMDIKIDSIVCAFLAVFTTITGKRPQFKANGGTARENLALQNIQARIRMVLAYLFSHLIMWCRGRNVGLLVLGSANTDESLRGYMTKYDCSSADINPIGGISKKDLKSFVFYCVEKFNFGSLITILGAPPTAELEPLRNGVAHQTDEADMGMTYDELSIFGRLRKVEACGPFRMFCKLCDVWRDKHPPSVIAQKVKHFFRCYAINRHKMTILTPSYHAESYSPDDNRFDLRPFLYNAAWNWQFRFIDEQVKRVDDQQRLPVRHFRSEDHGIGPGDENAPMEQNSAGSYGVEGNLGTNMHIKTEQSEGLDCNEEDSSNQRGVPDENSDKPGENEAINPLVQLGAKRKLGIERDWNHSKVKAVSLASPSMCNEEDSSNQRHAPENSDNSGENEAINPLVQLGTTGKLRESNHSKVKAVSLASPSMCKEEDSSNQRGAPENSDNSGENEAINPLVQLGTTGKLREWNHSKVKAVSLASPSMCNEQDSSNQRHAPQNSHKPGENEAIHPLVQIGTTGKLGIRRENHSKVKAVSLASPSTCNEEDSSNQRGVPDENSHKPGENEAIHPLVQIGTTGKLGIRRENHSKVKAVSLASPSTCNEEDSSNQRGVPDENSHKPGENEAIHPLVQIGTTGKLGIRRENHSKVKAVSLASPSTCNEEDSSNQRGVPDENSHKPGENEAIHPLVQIGTTGKLGIRRENHSKVKAVSLASPSTCNEEDSSNQRGVPDENSHKPGENEAIHPLVQIGTTGKLGIRRENHSKVKAVSLASPSTCNEEDSSNQRGVPDENSHKPGENEPVNPLVQLGAKRKLGIRREWNHSKVKLVSLASPSTSVGVGARRKRRCFSQKKSYLQRLVNN